MATTEEPQTYTTAPCGHSVKTLFDLMNERDRFYQERSNRFERVSDEREQRYKEKFEGQQEAVKTAMTSQEKAISAAFEASEKAITKAERAQENYNARSNEFRAALDDQQKTLLTRNEADTRFAQLRELIDSQTKVVGTMQNTLSRTEGVAKTVDSGKASQLVVLALLASLALVIIEGVGLIVLLIHH
jgi:predicted RNase H-like nuclease (RuvC/YqgF family)